MTPKNSFSALAIALLFAGLSAQAATLTGAVHSADGKTMEGVAVSARASDQTITTTVYTQQDGRYSFPALADGQYAIWAQAEGFDAGKSEQALSGSKNVQQNFALKPLQDFTSQLMGDEILAALPGSTPADLRMKAVFANNCTGCHQANFPLQNRFDEKGWTTILEFMSRTNPFAAIADPNNFYSPLVQSYKEELASYLARVRGPASAPLEIKLAPRPTGAGTQVVITEFDLPQGSDPSRVLNHNGTIWSEGEPSAHQFRAAHDAVADHDGVVWFTDLTSPDRTIGKMDPATGKVTGYKLADAQGDSVQSHGMGVDKDGNVWFTNGHEGTFTKFNPKTEQFTRYPRPDSMKQRVGGTVGIDVQGVLWSETSTGVINLDPATGKYTAFDDPVLPTESKAGTSTYGVTVDREGHAWFDESGIDRVVEVFPTGEIEAVALPPLNPNYGNDRDRELTRTILMGANNTTPIQRGPRRLSADPHSDYVWVGEYMSDQLARIDIKTRQVKEYPLPQFSRPYATAVDKNHMVWVSLMNTDRVAKFDPTTEQFTEYLLPTRGSEARFISVDNNTNPPSVWIPCYRNNKLARIQLRPATGVSAKSVAN
ncbi:MAG: carboxypeptidase regulatory-like domain-containing protein [Candidatus Acidiferrales bacterium]|jgi:streptogramin lyase